MNSEEVKVMIEKEYITGRIKIAECVMPTAFIDAENEICMQCSSKGCCLTVNLELASILERCKDSDGVYEFTYDDWHLLQARYPDAVNFPVR